ncbi:MAG: hypothetical protein JNL71_01960 [Rhodospirillales bacterium]|nr:hypothetical protein [Rhodospirillales bacterium]
MMNSKPQPQPRPTGLTEGHVVKGGVNPPTSQVVVRPPPPAPIRPAPASGSGTLKP